MLLILRLLLLTILLFLLFCVDFLHLSVHYSTLQAPVPWLIVCFCQTCVLAYPILRSHWTGWPLVVAIFFVFYGIIGFQTAIEALVFLQSFQEVMTSQNTAGVFVDTLFIAAVFSLVAVPLLGKWRPSTDPNGPNRRLLMPWYSWLWKLILIAVIYVIIYIVFGAFVFRPLAGEAFTEFYGDIELPAWFLPFQMLRGLIWAALAMPVIRMMKGRWWEAGLAVSLLFSVLMGLLLLPPNPYIPDPVRLAHLIEVSTSNFLFGCIVVALLRTRD